MEEALTALRADNRRDPENAAWASGWLGKLGRGVPREALLAAMRDEFAHGAAHGPVFKEWMIAHQDVAKQAKEKASLDKARAFLDTFLMGDPSKPETSTRLPAGK